MRMRRFCPLEEAPPYRRSRECVDKRFTFFHLCLSAILTDLLCMSTSQKIWPMEALFVSTAPLMPELHQVRDRSWIVLLSLLWPPSIAFRNPLLQVRLISDRSSVLLVKRIQPRCSSDWVADTHHRTPRTRCCCLQGRT